jgi:hypothetical protein
LFSESQNIMKKSFFVYATVTSLTFLLAHPIGAPAQGVDAPVARGPSTAPVAKTKRPAATQLAPSVTGRVGSRLGARLSPTTAPSEACVFDDNYSTGATNNGTTFCTNKLGYQELPAARQGRISAATIPQGYTLVLYERLDKTGRSCRLIGDNAGLDPTCDDMARAISLEADTAATLAQAQNEKARTEQASQARAVRSGQSWANNVEQARQAQLAEQRAQQEREARREAARAESVRIETERRQAEEAANLEKAQHLKILQEQSFGCLLMVVRSDGEAIFSSSEQTCINESTPYVGDSWNDDIETFRYWHWSGSSRLVVTLYEHSDYQGRSLRLVCGTYELIGDVENEVSSIKLEILPAPVPCFNGGQYTAKHDWDR